MFEVLLLICAAAVLPPACNRETALDVIIGPTAPNELVCGKHGQAYAAATPFVVAGETYLKIVCRRMGPA